MFLLLGLFGRGACSFSLCLGGGREFTHLPVRLPLFRDPATKMTKQQQKKHGFRLSSSFHVLFHYPYINP